MVTLAYFSIVIIGALLGAVLGFAGHFWRAHFTYHPEQVVDGGLGADLFNDAMNDKPLTFEKHVIGAKWDDYGYWDADSNRNLIYYVLSGFVTPLLAGLIFWSEREQVVGAVCDGLYHIGLNSPLCM